MIKLFKFYIMRACFLNCAILANNNNNIIKIQECNSMSGVVKWLIAYIQI